LACLLLSTLHPCTLLVAHPAIMTGPERPALGASCAPWPCWLNS
jgi:CBS-domain-containing membrane protein